MNLIYGKILEIFDDAGVLTGKVRVRGAMKNMVLELLPDAQPGDEVLLCDGVAISRVQNDISTDHNLCA